MQDMHMLVTCTIANGRKCGEWVCCSTQPLPFYSAAAMLWVPEFACTHHKVHAEALILACSVVVPGQPSLLHQLLHLCWCVSAAVPSIRCVLGVRAGWRNKHKRKL
jgi:hypothetical protein